MTIVRWGLLSTANINRRLIPAIRSSARGRLVAVASRSQVTADAYAAKWGIPQAFGSYESLLASESVDAVYVNVPNHLHATWTLAALKNGKHVLCEKPFALSLADVDAMAAAARSTGRVLAEAFMYRHHPQIKLAGEWVRSGRLGQITLVRAIFGFNLSNRPNIRLDPATGGGCLWDVGVYPVSFAQYIMGGPPLRVHGAQWLGATGVDEDFAGQLIYAGGAVAQIAGSFRTPFNTFAEIIGSEGRLTLNRPFVAGRDNVAREMLFHPDEGSPRPIPFGDADPYLGEIEDMHAAILDGRPPTITLDETRLHVATVLALYDSALERVNV